MTTPTTYSGQVLLRNDRGVLGHLRVELSLSSDARGDGWGGRILGSDYLVWGANNQRLTIEFDDGSTAQVVVRSGGALRGAGDAPAILQAG